MCYLNKYNEKLKGKKMKFYPYFKGQQHTNTYKTMLEHILGFIESNFNSGNNIVEALYSRTNNTSTKPELKQSKKIIAQNPQTLSLVEIDIIKKLDTKANILQQLVTMVAENKKCLQINSLNMQKFHKVHTI